MMGVIYGAMALMPLFVGDVRFIMHILIMCLIWAVVASCWDVIMGFAGIFSFGQVAFFVIGAYASAIFAVDFGVPTVLAILLAGLLTAAMGVLVGLPCLKLAGPYVALVTFGVHMTLMPLLRGDIGIAIGSGGSGGDFDHPTHQHLRIYLQFRQPGAYFLPDPAVDHHLLVDDHAGDQIILGHGFSGAQRFPGVCHEPGGQRL